MFTQFLHIYLLPITFHVFVFFTIWQWFKGVFLTPLFTCKWCMCITFIHGHVCLCSFMYDMNKLGVKTRSFSYKNLCIKRCGSITHLFVEEHLYNWHVWQVIVSKLFLKTIIWVPKFYFETIQIFIDSLRACFFTRVVDKVLLCSCLLDTNVTSCPLTLANTILLNGEFKIPAI